jgi:hypothetical protein
MNIDGRWKGSNEVAGQELWGGDEDEEVIVDLR